MWLGGIFFMSKLSIISKQLQLLAQGAEKFLNLGEHLACPFNTTIRSKSGQLICEKEHLKMTMK